MVFSSLSKFRTMWVSRRRAGEILCVLLVTGALASPADASPVTLDANSTEVHPGRGALEILEDPTGQWDLAQVTSPRIRRRFSPATEDEPAFGFSSSAYWARFEVINHQPGADTFMVELSYPLLDRVDLYVRRPDGTFQHQRGGDHFPFDQRVVRHRNVIFPVKLVPGRTTEIYLRVATTSSVQIPVVLWSRSAFQHKDHTEQMLLGLYYGLVLVMLFYNLFIFISVRERAYLLFVLFLGSYGLTQAALNGLAFEFLWPSAIWWANSCVPFFISVTILTTLIFSRDFLQTRRTAPRMDRALRLLAGLYLVVAPLSLVLSYSAGIRIAVAGCVVVPLTITGTAIHALIRGYRAARFFVLAWLAFFLGIVAHALLAYGVLPRNWLTDNFHQIGSAMQVILLSFALGDRINLIKREKDEALGRALESERRSLEIERRSRETLQHEVDRQTEELRAANLRLQEVDRQKTLFFQNVSHELRSPLTVLLNPLERLLAADLTGPPGLDVKERLRAMERNAHRLLRLVNQLLDFARLESGRSEPSFERRDLVAFVQPIVDGFQAFAAARELRLELRAGEELPQVYFDPEKLDTVMCNLISNACKFTEPGGAVLVKVDVADGQARVAVKDSGIGIPGDQLQRIFDRFQQADDSSRRRYQGTGIGLALARELAQAMGGSVTVESDVGFGSTFMVSLPLGKGHIKDPSRIRTRQENGEAERQRLAEESQHAAHALAGEVGLGASEDEPEAAGSDKPRVLVVEDSPDMRAVIAEIRRETRPAS